MAEMNKRVFVAVQIENLSGLSQVDEIAAIEGLDSLALGPFDLSIALGRPGEISHPEVDRELRRIVQSAKAHGKYIGTGMGAYADAAMDAAAMGIQWIQCGGDYGYMVAKVDDLMSSLRTRFARRS